MTVSYTYSTPTDFPVAGTCAPDALQAAVGANRAISVVCEGINTSGSVVSVVFRSALSLEEKTVLDGIVSAHDGVALEKLGQWDDHGNRVFAPSFLFTKYQAGLEGYALVCDPGATAILDVQVTSQTYVQGGQFWISGGAIGDKCHFAVVDKNNVLGLHTLYGLPLGTPIELVRYVKNYRLPPVPFFQDTIVMPTVAKVVTGLYLRAIMEATAGGAQRHIGITYRWYREA